MVDNKFRVEQLNNPQQNTNLMYKLMEAYARNLMSKKHMSS